MQADEAPGGIHGGPDRARGRQGIRVRLSTLLRLDGHPGEVSGLGSVPAEVARELVTERYPGARSRFAVTGAEGRLVLAGSLRRRHHLARRAGNRRKRGGVVEIHLPAALLEALQRIPLPRGRWRTMVSEIAAQDNRRDELAAAVGRHPAGRLVRAAATHVQIQGRTGATTDTLRPARVAEADRPALHPTRSCPPMWPIAYRG